MAEKDLNYEKQIIDRQRRLTELLGTPGSEQNVANAIIDEIKDVVDEYWINSNGSLLAVMKGRDESSAILLDAHTDEIGFVISHITEKGFAYFTLLGGFDERILLGQSVFVETKDGTRVYGVIGALPPHILSADDRKKPITAKIE